MGLAYDDRMALHAPLADAVIWQAERPERILDACRRTSQFITMDRMPLPPSFPPFSPFCFISLLICHHSDFPNIDAELEETGVLNDCIAIEVLPAFER